jgi:DNA-binding MarR family transcriptional regulator
MTKPPATLGIAPLPAPDRARQPRSPPDPPLDPTRLAALTGYNLRRAYLAMQQRLLMQLAPHELTAAEFSVLVLLDGNGSATQRQLCEALAIAPPNMVGLLERLQRRGLLERGHGRADRRTRIVSATVAGTRLLRRAEQTVLGCERRALLHFDAEELATLRRLLIRLYRENAATASE